MKFSASRIGRLQIRYSGSSSRKKNKKKMAEKVQFGSKLPLGKIIPLYDMFATSCIFPSSSFSLNWSLRNSTAMKVRAEAGMYHVILGTLPLNNPLTPSIIQILRIASSPPLYLRVHHNINKQYYCQNYWLSI